MAERNGGTCDVVLLNLDHSTKDRSRLPRPRNRGRSHQPASPNLDNSIPERIKFPQLEMTKNIAPCATSKIPQPDPTLRANINLVKWLKPRPKTSVDVCAHHRGTTSADRRSHFHQQLKRIEGSKSRRNSTEEQPVFARFPTLPAIGLSRPNTAETPQSPTGGRSLDGDINTNDSIAHLIMPPNGCNDSPFLKTKETSLGHLEDPELPRSDTEIIPDSELDANSRPLIRSETYDVLPTLNEEEDDVGMEDDDEDTENDEELDKESILTAMQVISAATDSSDDEASYATINQSNQSRSSASSSYN